MKTKKIKTVALEDLLTWTILVFLGSAKEVGWDGKTPIQEWYTSLTAKQMRQASDKILQGLEKEREMEKAKAAKRPRKSRG